MTDNQSVDELGYEDQHMFHEYVGGDASTCPCQGCTDARRAEFDADDSTTEEDWDAGESVAAEAHDDAVERWVERARGTSLSAEDIERLRALHQTREDARNAFSAACAARAEGFRAAHDEGASYASIAEAVGLHRSAVHQTVTRRSGGEDA